MSRHGAMGEIYCNAYEWWWFKDNHQFEARWNKESVVLTVDGNKFEIPVEVFNKFVTNYSCNALNYEGLNDE